MYCSTCGARVPDGRSHCDTCGAAVSRPAGFGVQSMANPIALMPITCPRCGYNGPTVGYFSQGGPIAGLTLLTLMTMPFMGAGGILYYILRHDFRACARCRETLGKGKTLALAAHPGGVQLPASAMAAATAASLPEDRRGLSFFGAIALFLFAAFISMIGLAEGEPVAVLMGLMSAGAGVGLLKRSQTAREERRAALITALQQPVLRLAGERGGRLTVTEVATSFGWPIPRAEKVLNSLDDGLRVRSDVTDEGVIVYEFRELMHRPRITAAEMDTMLGAAPPLRHLEAQPQTQAQPLPLPQDGTLRA